MSVMLKAILRFLSRVGRAVIDLFKRTSTSVKEEVSDMKSKMKLFTKDKFVSMFKEQASYFFLSALLSIALPVSLRGYLGWLNVPYLDCFERYEGSCTVGLRPVKALSLCLMSIYSQAFL